MRGIGDTLSRLPAVSVLFTGAAILSGAFAPMALAEVPGSGVGNRDDLRDGSAVRPQADETAFAAPRFRLRDGRAVIDLPRPLGAGDAALVRRIFALQARGDIPAAVRATEDLDDRLLTGTILADRYLGRTYRTSGTELADWLERFGDQPSASAIHALLLHRLPKGAPVPPTPTAAALGDSPPAGAQPLAPAPPEPGVARNPLLDRAIADRMQRGNAPGALRLITSTKGLDPVYAAQLRGEVAQAQFAANEDEEALRTALTALRQAPPGTQVGLVPYVGGLAAWRLDRKALARELFENATRATYATSHLRAAAAFWAARASRHYRDAAGTTTFLRRAAEERWTLHGLVARRILGMQTGILPSAQLLSTADAEAVAVLPAGRRAFALLQIGQPRRAEAELASLWPIARHNRALSRSLLLVGCAAGLTDFAARLAAEMDAASGTVVNEFQIPMPRLLPADGFSVDPALVYAVTRLESNFDNGAISAVGARGLMQIRPETAQYISGDTFLPGEQLHDPGLNLKLGQRYIRYLADQEGVDHDLLRVLAAYNAGPGSVARWQATLRDDGDPLLFIEAIPNDQTRAFVQAVLTYSWIYAARLHLPAPSLDEMAAGEFPRFTPQPGAGKISLREPLLN